MAANVRVEGNVEQLVQGHAVYAAHGDDSEAGRQAEFYRNTGIYCARGAREAMESLMQHHGFVTCELAAAWRYGYLCWDSASGNLYVVLSRQPLLIYSYGVLAGLSIAALVGGFLANSALSTIASAIVAVATAVLFTRRIVMPYRVAARLKRVL